MKLLRAARFVYHHHSITTTKITFLSAAQDYARLLQVPLVAPETADYDTKLAVKVVIGTDVDIGQGESDLTYVISDGHYFVGAHFRDKNNYNNLAPCVAIEGSSGKQLGADRRVDSALPKPSKSYYSGRVEFLLSLSDRWGTCFVSLDGGFSREMTFQRKLDPRSVLFFEIYADTKEEKYIEARISQEN